jgi:hypothetical protein
LKKGAIAKSASNTVQPAHNARRSNFSGVTGGCTTQQLAEDGTMMALDVEMAPTEITPFHDRRDSLEGQTSGNGNCIDLGDVTAGERWPQYAWAALVDVVDASEQQKMYRPGTRILEPAGASGS